MFGMKSRKQTGNMNATEANAVLDVLIGHALAGEWDRNLFVELQTNDSMDECSLMGSKYQGTKFFVSHDPRQPWKVSTYNDYLRDHEQKVVNDVNTELMALYTSLRG